MFWWFSLKKTSKIIRFDVWLWKKHQKLFVLIIGFEKNIENHLIRLLALKKTSKIIRFDYYQHRPGLQQYQITPFDSICKYCDIQSMPLDIVLGVSGYSCCQQTHIIIIIVSQDIVLLKPMPYLHRYIYIVFLSF